MKEFSASAIKALKDALKNIYWEKQDLKNFIKISIKNDTILNTIDWETNRKFESVNELINRMVDRKDIYYDDLLNLIRETANIDDFSHFKSWDDSEIKIKKAKDSVEILRQHTKGFFQLEKEKKESEERKTKIEDREKTFKNNQEQIADLNEKFLKLAMEENKQKREILLEDFLNELFTIYDLNPKKSFKLKDEQIDGAFTFDSGDYLLEAKWEAKPIETGDLKKFGATLEEKLKITLGLFISINGFTEGARNFRGLTSKSIILMDGSDLNAVLEQRIDLYHLLRRKRRHASETGEIYYPVIKILNE